MKLLKGIVSQRSDAFVMTVDTNEIGPSGSKGFVIPCTDIGTYNATVDWGDGSTSTITAYDDADLSHTYASSGIYTISITGTLPSIAFKAVGDCQKVISITNWGDVGFEDLEGAFNGCRNLVSLPSGGWITCSGTNFKQIFDNSNSLVKIPNNLFRGCPNVLSFEKAFARCNSSVIISPNVFAGCSVATDFSGAFSFIGLTTEIPANLFKDCVSADTFFQTFQEVAVTSLPEGLFRNCSVATTLDSCFEGCNGLTSLPSGLFTGCTGVSYVTGVFENCLNLTTVPVDLFQPCTASLSFGGIFKGCTSLTSVPAALFQYNTLCGDFNGSFDDMTLDTDSYSDLLINLEQYNSNTLVFFGANNSKYNAAGGVARAALVSDHSWVFFDGGPV